MEKYPRG